MELATRACPLCGLPIVFFCPAYRIGPIRSTWLYMLTLLVIFELDIANVLRALRMSKSLLDCSAGLVPRMFHVKHSGHFSFLFEPIIFLTTDPDNFRGKLFHVKHNEKSAANGVRLYFLCRHLL